MAFDSVSWTGNLYPKVIFNLDETFPLMALSSLIVVLSHYIALYTNVHQFLFEAKVITSK